MAKKKKNKEQTDKEIRIYYEDLNIAQALLDGDKNVAMEFYFKGSYPLFKALYDDNQSYFESCEDLMTDVFVLILTRNSTGKRPLENFTGNSTLRSWIKSVAYFYCCKIRRSKNPINFSDSNPDLGDINPVDSGTIIKKEEEEEVIIDKTKLDLDKLMRHITEMNELSDPTPIIEKMDKMGLDRKTLERLISKMKNERYARIMRLFLIEHCSKDEIATMEKMTKTVCENTLSRAKRQFKAVYGKEVQNV